MIIEKELESFEHEFGGLCIHRNGKRLAVISESDKEESMLKDKIKSKETVFFLDRSWIIEDQVGAIFIIAEAKKSLENIKNSSYVNVVDIKMAAGYATPGPWKFGICDVGDEKTLFLSGVDFNKNKDNNAAYINKVTPDVIIAMIEEIERLSAIIELKNND